MEVSTKMAIYAQLPSYAADANKRMRPSAFMDYAQELAYLSATELGFGYDKLICSNMAWVLSRFHIEFKKDILWTEDFSMQTWHKGMNGLFFLRDFRLENGEAEECIAATSSWIVLDLQKRSFVRPNVIMTMVPPESECHESAVEVPAPKLVIPRDMDMEHVGQRVVNYSDVDFLGHTNNVRYVVWSMDVAGQDISFGRRCKELFINFVKETHVGETVDLYRNISRLEDGTVEVLVEGRVDTHQSFICKLIFQ